MVRKLLGNIKGQKGDKGEQGVKGDKGDPGFTTINEFKDGVSDEIALENFLNHESKDKYLSEGVYNITKTISVELNGVHLYGTGILSFNTSEDAPGLEISGDNNTVSVNIEGNNKARRGLEITGANNIVENCNIKNINANNHNATGILCYPTGSLVVKDNIIENVYSKTNNKIGDFVGSSRAIYILPQENTDETIIVSGNKVKNITGEEGDAIHIMSDLNVKTVIKDNVIEGFSRRGMKIQHSNVTILNNLLHENNLDSVNPSRAIDLIGGSNISVVNNTVDITTVSFVGSSGTENNVCKSVVISDNIVNQKNSKHVFYSTHTDNMVFKRNNIYGGNTAICANSNTVDISDNVFHKKHEFVSGSIIVVYANNNNVKTTNNLLMESVGDSFVSNSSVDKVDENNKILKIVR